MINKWVSAFGGLYRIGGWMLLLYLICNAAVLYVSFTSVGTPATIMSLLMAVKLANLPREKFIETRVRWTSASVSEARMLTVAAVVLHIASSAAAFLAVWFVIPHARPAIPFIAGIALVTALASGRWGLWHARKPWGQYGLW